MCVKSLLMFLVVLASKSFAQTINLLPLKTTCHIKDSVVEMIVYEKSDGLWKKNANYRNEYFYDENGLLHAATVSNQNYSFKRKNGRIIRATIYNGKKRQTKLVYLYNKKDQIYKIEVSNYVNGAREAWGSEYLEYDSLNRLISSSYTIQNNLSSHPGYSHNATYQYDESGKLTAEDWGYQQKTHYYKENKLEYTYIVDREFGKTAEYKRQYQITVIK